jgi:hypothetical protein
MPALNNTKALPPQYLSGYVDGEGCFTVSFSRRPKLRIGWETRPSFSVSQNADRAQVLYAMLSYFGAGHLRRDPANKTLKYEVRDLNDLIDKVVPHFEVYPLLSDKQHDFLLFGRICRMIRKGMHHTSGGLATIVALAYQMNPSGVRRYARSEILNSVGEMKI